MKPIVSFREMEDADLLYKLGLNIPKCLLKTNEGEKKKPNKGKNKEKKKRGCREGS